MVVPQTQANKFPDEVWVTFSDEVNPLTASTLIALISRCINDNVKIVHLLLSTPGGGTMQGLNLYNMLRAAPFELRTYNAGSVNSIGNVIFLAGEKRFAATHSTFMFHGVGLSVNQAARLEEKNLREHLNAILNDQKRIGGIIAERTSLSDAEVEQLFREAKTKDANEALQSGIIHEIKDIQIPAGSTVVPLVFQRQPA